MRWLNVSLLINYSVFCVILFYGSLSEARDDVLNDVNQTLKLAYQNRSADPQQSTALLDSLDRKSLTSEQKGWFDYLRAFEKYIHNDFEGAIDDLHEISLRENPRDFAVLVQSFSLVLHSAIQRWNGAFTLYNEIISDINTIDDQEVIENAHVAIMNFYLQINEHEVNANYIEPLLNGDFSLRFACNVRLRYTSSLVETKPEKLSEAFFNDVLSLCENLDEPIINLSIQGIFARYYFYRKDFTKALKVIDSQLPKVEKLVYKRVVAEFYELKSLISLAVDDTENAKYYSERILAGISPEALSNPIISAHKILYQIGKREGDFEKALQSHEKYLIAVSRNINRENARLLAIEKARRDLEEKSMQIELLDRENSLLSTKALFAGQKANNRMLIISLMAVCLSISIILVYNKQRHFATLREQSTRDSLTGIANRRHFLSRANQANVDAKTDQLPISLVIFDIDNFKRINDNYGHLEGDNAIQICVEAAKRGLRYNDLIGRIGGEEFGLLLEGATLKQAMHVAEKCRKNIVELAAEKFLPYPLTASFGVACAIMSQYDYKALFERADKMLYKAKNTGKNKVEA